MKQQPRHTTSDANNQQELHLENIDTSTLHKIDTSHKLIALSRDLIETHSIYEIARRTLDFFLDCTHTTRGFVLLNASPYHHIAATHGFKAHDLMDTKHPDAQCYLTAVETVKTGETSSLTHEPTSVRAYERTTFYSLPLTAHGLCLGVIYLDRQENHTKQTLPVSLDFLDELVALTAHALHNANRIKAKESDLKSTKRLVNQQQHEMEMQKYSFDSFLGISQKKRELFQTIQQTIDTSTTITITGESGVGKELIARIIHYNGPRRHHRFIAFNCAAIPEALLESELFGYVQGAFTGADENKEGLFVKASEGTLFLDEIGEMPLSIQAKLLRILQDKEVCQIGSDTPRKIDARIICTTNHDLTQLVTDGKFREDLLYRVNVVMIEVPSLRERRDDIPILAEHALHLYAAENNVPQKELSAEAEAFLARYPWPGNVRELVNVMSNLAIFVEAPVIELPDILKRKGLLTHPMMEHAQAHPTEEKISDLGRMIDEGQLTLSAAKRLFEKIQIEHALKLYNGQITNASEHLKMPRPQVSRLMKRYGLKG